MCLCTWTTVLNICLPCSISLLRMFAIIWLNRLICSLGFQQRFSSSLGSGYFSIHICYQQISAGNFGSILNAYGFSVSLSSYSCFSLLQPGTFDLVGTVIYEIDQSPYQSTFFNGTFEVTEASGPLSVESVFLFFLGIGLVGLLGIWIRSQIQHFSKVITGLHPYTMLLSISKMLFTVIWCSGSLTIF